MVPWPTLLRQQVLLINLTDAIFTWQACIHYFFLFFPVVRLAGESRKPVFLYRIAAATRTRENARKVVRFMVVIQAYSRLHFGLLNPVAQERGGSRCFGGVGVMIRHPDLTLC